MSAQPAVFIFSVYGTLVQTILTLSLNETVFNILIKTAFPESLDEND